MDRCIVPEKDFWFEIREKSGNKQPESAEKICQTGGSDGRYAAR
jgi:hypothetical protein